MNTQLTFIRWVVAWLLLIASGVAGSKITFGEKLIYYVLWLSITLIVVTHYQQISKMFTFGPQGQEQQILIQGQI